MRFTKSANVSATSGRSTYWYFTCGCGAWAIVISGALEAAQIPDRTNARPVSRLIHQPVTAPRSGSWKCDTLAVVQQPIIEAVGEGVAPHNVVDAVVVEVADANCDNGLG